MFIAAESFWLPVKCSSSASCLRAARLLSIFSSFIKSTIECRQSRSSSDSSASLSMTAATSTCALVGGDPLACAAAGADEVGAPGCAAAAGDATGGEAGAGAAFAGPPKIDDMMVPNTLMAALRCPCGATWDLRPAHEPSRTLQPCKSLPASMQALSDRAIEASPETTCAFP